MCVSPLFPSNCTHRLGLNENLSRPVLPDFESAVYAMEHLLDD